MTKRIPPGAYSTRDILRIARKLGVIGKLLRIQSNGLEVRAYPGHQPGNPWVVIARRDEHTI